MPTSTTQDYLKTIWMLENEHPDNGLVPLGRIAERLGLTPGTVTSMMNHLAGRGWVAYEPRRGVALLPEGRREAVAILRRHRVIEAFLVDVLRLDWSEVHEEAEILEHAVSERVLNRMDEMLGHPSHDPHGDPIPGPDGVLPAENLASLDRVRPGRHRLVRVLETSRDFLAWLDGRGIRPGIRLCLLGVDENSGTLDLRVEGGRARRMTLALAVARQLLVEAPDALAVAGAGAARVRSDTPGKSLD